MQTFAAQVKTGDSDLDVSITITERDVRIAAGDDDLGRWRTRDCHFERLAPAAYELRLPDDRVHMQVVDDTGFRAALALIREEQGGLVPRPLVWIGAVAVTAAVVTAAFVGGESASAEAQVAVAVEGPAPSSTTMLGAPPTTLPEVTAGFTEDAVQPSARLLASWNGLAGGTPLELDGAGPNELGDMTVVIADHSIVVDAVPTGTSANAELIIGALGLTVATADVEATPSERAAVLTELGLRIDAANLDPLHNQIEHNGVRYTLDYDPGAAVRLEAALEW